MKHDPLFVVNPKVPCPECQRTIQAVRSLCSHCSKSRKICKTCDTEASQMSTLCTTCGGSRYKPVDLSGLWAPSAGFLVCGGPSINKLPFEKLKERGIVSLAVNNVAGHVPVTAWTFSDPQSKFHHGMLLDPKILTFMPIGKLKRKVRVKLPDGTFRGTNIRMRNCPGTFAFSRKTTFDAKTFLTTDYAHWGRGGKQPDEDRPFTCLCTMLLGIRLLHYLGCPRVYMLGVDFLMTKEEQYSFGQTSGVRNGRYAKENAMLAELKPYFDKEGFQLFNCNPDSGCDVFPKVSFDQAYQDCKGCVPEEPFDLKDWYNKGLAKEQSELHPETITREQLIRIQNSGNA